MQINREENLKAWLEKEFAQDLMAWEALSGDAGFRCYYRFKVNGNSYIAVDAPNTHSNNQAFVNVHSLLNGNAIKVPKIICVDLSAGFFCLEDLGDELLSQVTLAERKAFYLQAIDELAKITELPLKEADYLPDYDSRLLDTEMQIFVDWLLGEHLNIVLSENESQALQEAFRFLKENALEQPQVVVHRDYHSRNLMLTVSKEIAVIDFQDAVKGPITYDIVSLLRDCYILLPHDELQYLLAYFIQKLKALNLPSIDNISDERLHRWFDLMGVQRHVKASGIFARLHHRDGKSHYLKDIPLTLSYVKDVSLQYPELEILHHIITYYIEPALVQKKNDCLEELS